MAQKADFIQFKCVGTYHSTCTSCPRDFIIPISQITGIYKDPSGNAIFGLYKLGEHTGHFCVNPNCLMTTRLIDTQMTWSSAITLLDGALVNIGDCVLTASGDVE